MKINKSREGAVRPPLAKNRETNHEMIAKALKGFAGQEIETKQFNEIILKAFPNFTTGSLLPNDHAKGNKSDCPCADTENRLLDRLERGLFRVIPKAVAADSRGIPLKSLF